MIGEKLDTLLKAKGIRPGTLAKMTGIPKETIYSIIKRNNKRINLSNMERIAETLEVPMEYFLSGDDADPAQKEKPDIPEDDELEEFMQLFDQLTDEQKSFILSSMKGILAGK